MTEYLQRENIFAFLAIAVALVRYGTYVWSIYKKETRPHAFSWFLWGLITGIAAFAQFELGGGLSAWVLAVVTASCLMLSVVAVFVGEKNITRSDWAALWGALAAIGVWASTGQPLLAIACIIVVDVLSYWPTIRKSWHDPWGEPPASYFWAGLRYFLTLFAVPEFTLSSLVYPFWLMVCDWGFMIYIIWRRRVLQGVDRK